MLAYHSVNQFSYLLEANPFPGVSGRSLGSFFVSVYTTAVNQKHPKNPLCKTGPKLQATKKSL